MIRVKNKCNGFTARRIGIANRQNINPRSALWRCNPEKRQYRRLAQAQELCNKSKTDKSRTAGSIGKHRKKQFSKYVNKDQPTFFWLQHRVLKY
jgi:hypothetical protein